MDSSRKTVAYDRVIDQIASYTFSYTPKRKEAFETATLCLADTLGCALLALNYPACTKLLGPMVPGGKFPKGARVPGTSYVLSPVEAAFNLGTMLRWLDYNDTWLAAEWGHPSDNLGGILALADYLDRNGKNITIEDVLVAMIKAHEIQGRLALENSFNKVGFDHVILVKIATAAVATQMLGGSKEQIADALSQAWIDIGPLRTYRHAPNTGSRKSWAAGDATSRGLWLAFLTLRGEMGYSQALSAKQWGLYDVLFDGQPFTFPDLPSWEKGQWGSYVMEHVLFKIAFPAEFHAQTAVEAALQLHPKIKDKEIERVDIYTHASAIRIIDKKGPLHNPADRDHCLQYMVAIALLYGELTADHYEERIAKDVRIDQLRKNMKVIEDPRYSQDYLDPNKRSIANRVEIILKGSSPLGPVEVQYPLGHRKRREEGVPLLLEKFRKNVGSRFGEERTQKIYKLFKNPKRLEKMRVGKFMDFLITS